MANSDWKRLDLSEWAFCEIHPANRFVATGHRLAVLSPESRRAGS